MEADKPGNPKANDATSPPKKRDNTTSFVKIQKNSKFLEQDESKIKEI